MQEYEASVAGLDSHYLPTRAPTCDSDLGRLAATAGNTRAALIDQVAVIGQVAKPQASGSRCVLYRMRGWRAEEAADCCV